MELIRRKAVYARRFLGLEGYELEVELECGHHETMPGRYKPKTAICFKCSRGANENSEGSEHLYRVR
jgi:hypothetical protein